MRMNEWFCVSRKVQKGVLCYVKKIMKLFPKVLYSAFQSQLLDSAHTVSGSLCLQPFLFSLFSFPSIDAHVPSTPSKLLLHLLNTTHLLNQLF